MRLQKRSQKPRNKGEITKEWNEEKISLLFISIFSLDKQDQINQCKAANLRKGKIIKTQKIKVQGSGWQRKEFKKHGSFYNNCIKLATEKQSIKEKYAYKLKQIVT